MAAGSVGLLYIGMPGSSLERRNHFVHADSGFFLATALPRRAARTPLRPLQ
jgi:hypothetical protein